MKKLDLANAPAEKAVIDFLTTAGDKARLPYGDIEFHEDGLLGIEMRMTAEQWTRWIRAIRSMPDKL